MQQTRLCALRSCGCQWKLSLVFASCSATQSWMLSLASASCFVTKQSCSIRYYEFSTRAVSIHRHFFPVAIYCTLLHRDIGDGECQKKSLMCFPRVFNKILLLPCSQWICERLHNQSASQRCTRFPNHTCSGDSRIVAHLPRWG